MRIVNIVESTRPIRSDIRNAYIDFSKMTLSLVAVVTDVVRDGRAVVGYGFNSNGRYGQGGLIRERFVPRILEADPASLLDETGDNLDPHRIWARMMTNEKPGGHGERSVAVGTLDMAVWDATAKIAGLPLHELLARRFGDGAANPRVFVYAAGGYYYPGKDLDGLASRDDGLPRARVHRRQDEDRRREPRRGLRADRGRAEAPRSRPPPRRRCQRTVRPRHGGRVRARARALPVVLVRGGGRPARLRAAG
jgi:L-alanine-DL-glutamate epimerase-like enolase superfamily enzyme